jgi:hypothetical protein
MTRSHNLATQVKSTVQMPLPVIGLWGVPVLYEMETLLTPKQSDELLIQVVCPGGHVDVYAMVITLPTTEVKDDGR